MKPVAPLTEEERQHTIAMVNAAIIAINNERRSEAKDLLRAVLSMLGQPE